MSREPEWCEQIQFYEVFDSPASGTAEPLEVSAQESSHSRNDTTSTAGRRPSTRVTVTMCRLLATAVVLTPGGAMAIVHDEHIRAGDPSQGWTGTIDSSVSVSRGNIPFVDLGAGARLTWEVNPAQRDGSEKEATHQQRTEPLRRGPVDRLAFALAGHFSRYSGVLYAKNAFAYASWLKAWTETLSANLFAQVEYNELLLLQSRSIAGGGIRWEAFVGPAVHTAIGTGYMVEREVITKPSDWTADDYESEALRSLAHRSSSYLAVQVQIVERRLIVKNTVYVQPRIDRFSDWRALDVLQIRVEVDPTLSLSLEAQVHHDSEPPFNVKQTDALVRNVLRWSF